MLKYKYYYIKQGDNMSTDLNGKTTNKLMVTLGVLTIIFSAIEIIITIMTAGMDVFTFINFMLVPIGVGFLLYSYLKHKKNLQKPIMGSLLTYQLCMSTSYLTSYIVSGMYPFKDMKEDPILLLLEIVNVVIYGLIFINHFLLNSSKLSNKRIRQTSVTALLFLFVSYGIQIAYSLCTFTVKPNQYLIIAWLVAFLRDFSLMALIVHTEAKIDRYKEKREQFREQYGFEDDDRVILQVAQQTPRKGIYEFIDLAKRLPEYKFIWVGGFSYGSFSSEKKEVEKRKAEAPSNIQFPGFVDDVSAAYAGADVFLIPSYKEIMPMSILEALSSGLPVFARKLNEYHSLYPGAAGFFDNIDEVIPMLADDELLSRSAANARKSVEQNDMYVVAQNHANLYKKLCGDS